MMVLHGDALEMLKTLPSESVQCCVTSPPYWGLRDYGVSGQLGLEKTPEEYVQNMVNVFREVRRVLRKDGTLWLNLGDSYWGGKGQSAQAWSTENQDRDTLQQSQHQITGMGETRPQDGKHDSIKPKDLVGIPWMLAFALRADGWWLRQDIIWYKRNPMPESVTDRCTKAHEYIFLLTKSARYYYDAEAVKEEATRRASGVYDYKYQDKNGHETKQGLMKAGLKDWDTKNLRSVWDITTKGFPGAHFATFPPEIPERCIKAGTSEKGCCSKCGSPVERIIGRNADKPDTIYTSSSKPIEINAIGHRTQGMGQKYQDWLSANPMMTVGWEPTCSCNAETQPCVVLDPFAGAGTTLWVAKRLGRAYIGIELNEKYIKDHIEPRLADVDPLFANVS